MEAIILAGGFGTRLKSLGLDVPKPMVPVEEIPFLQYLMNFLQQNGVHTCVLSVGYKWEKIKDYFGEKFKDISLIYSIEDKPLGTGGAIRESLKYCKHNNVLVVNGDTFFEVDLKKMFDYHNNLKSNFTVASKFVKDFSRYGRIVADERGKIIDFEEKQASGEGLINGGIYCLDKEYYLSKSTKGNFSLERDFLGRWVKEASYFSFTSDGYFIDIGLPEDYLLAQNKNKTLMKYA